MSKKIAAEQERLNKIGTKFTDIKAMRERIIGDSTIIGGDLKKMLTQRKAMSPETMTKNIKSISSFLDNFNRMVASLGTKLDSLATQLNEVNEKTKKIAETTKSI